LAHQCKMCFASKKLTVSPRLRVHRSLGLLASSLTARWCYRTHRAQLDFPRASSLPIATWEPTSLKSVIIHGSTSASQTPTQCWVCFRSSISVSGSATCGAFLCLMRIHGCVAHETVPGMPPDGMVVRRTRAPVALVLMPCSPHRWPGDYECRLTIWSNRSDLAWLRSGNFPCCDG